MSTASVSSAHVSLRVAAQTFASRPRQVFKPYSALAMSARSVPRGGLLSNLVGVATEGHFQLAKRICLNLVGILEFLDPLSLFVLQTSHFGLDLHAFLVFFVDATNELHPLLLPLNLLLVLALLHLLLLLGSDHLLHLLSLHFVCLLLDLNHFFMLCALLL